WSSPLIVVTAIRVALHLPDALPCVPHDTRSPAAGQAALPFRVVSDIFLFILHKAGVLFQFSFFA
ncbi:MAG TPA: hypothetical protein PKN85_07715, partial [Syntrophorhabdaceae bacterium]|nr:hypothetical protein [Syntrophorhabdaceae bacterium]